MLSEVGASPKFAAFVCTFEEPAGAGGSASDAAGCTEEAEHMGYCRRVLAFRINLAEFKSPLQLSKSPRPLPGIT